MEEDGAVYCCMHGKLKRFEDWSMKHRIEAIYFLHMSMIVPNESIRQTP